MQPRPGAGRGGAAPDNDGTGCKWKKQACVKDPGSESGAITDGGDSFDSACADSTTWHKKNKDKQNCAWVGKKAAKRCKAKVMSEDGVKASDACPVACGTCDPADDEIAALKAENAALTAENAALTAENAALTAELETSAAALAVAAAGKAAAEAANATNAAALETNAAELADAIEKKETCEATVQSLEEANASGEGCPTPAPTPEPSVSPTPAPPSSAPSV